MMRRWVLAKHAMVAAARRRQAKNEGGGEVESPRR